MPPICLKDLLKASEDFDGQEKRGNFFDMARELLDAGFETAACYLLLATWNIAWFRTVANECDIPNFKQVMADLASDFAFLKPFEFKTIDLDAHGPRIKKVYDALAKVREVKFTGATKIMHLKCPSLFVIWDRYIRGIHEPGSDYDNLRCAQAGTWTYGYYGDTGEEYLRFLRDTQKKFQSIDYPAGSRTFAKAIDEFNYVNVTLPIQKAVNARKPNKKKKKSR